MRGKKIWGDKKEEFEVTRMKKMKQRDFKKQEENEKVLRERRCQKEDNSWLNRGKKRKGGNLRREKKNLRYETSMMRCRVGRQETDVRRK